MERVFITDRTLKQAGKRMPLSFREKIELSRLIDRLEPDAVELEHVRGEIEFKNVWFAYEKDEWILKDVSFVIEPRQTVAFVGATGAGKTTILSLIVRN